MGEFDLIAQIEARLARKTDAADGLILGIGDDAALLRAPAGQAIAITSDTLNAGVHFLPEASAEDIGYKALAVSLSDLAAMGAKPWWFNLNLSLPDLDFDWTNAFIEGLSDAMELCGIHLIGGDTTRGPLSIGITAAGLVSTENALRRDRAVKGQDVWVSGTLGDAACALRHADTASVDLLGRLNRPTPRLSLGQRLAEAGLATAAVDVSDGLLADVGHVAARSRVSLKIHADRLPLSEDMRKLAGEDALKFAASGGDDYELAFTADPARADAILAAAKELNVAVTRIGSVVDGAGIKFIDANGGEIPSALLGYEHFSST